MKYSPSSNKPAGASTPHVPRTSPVSCPICRSSSIVTSAKIPDEASYWRCMSCGEVWNDSRRQAPVHRDRRW